MEKPWAEDTSAPRFDKQYFLLKILLNPFVTLSVEMGHTYTISYSRLSTLPLENVLAMEEEREREIQSKLSRRKCDIFFNFLHLCAFHFVFLLLLTVWRDGYCTTTEHTTGWNSAIACINSLQVFYLHLLLIHFRCSLWSRNILKRIRVERKVKFTRRNR